eukprot:c25107_g1_i1 orf=450-1613(-)
MVALRGLARKVIHQEASLVSLKSPILIGPRIMSAWGGVSSPVHESRSLEIGCRSPFGGVGSVRCSYRSELHIRASTLCKTVGNLSWRRKSSAVKKSVVNTHTCRVAHFYSDMTQIWFQSTDGLDYKFRKLWTTAPIQMGRRSSKIAMRKGVQDAKKSKLYGKIGKQIVSVVKKGGSPNPVANSELATVLQLAKELDIPKEIIERNIKKASEKGQQDFVEITYEVYGFGGVGLVVDVLTDNCNRAAANVRDVVKKCGGKMADPGSVLFNFRRAGVMNVRSDKVELDDLLAIALDAGAEDVTEPSFYEDDDDEDLSDKYYRVITPVEQYAAVSKKLQEAGISVDVEESGLELIPVATFEPDDEAIDLNKVLIGKLLELDDVDAVYSNQV